MENEEFEVKRINDAKKKVLQYREISDALEHAMGQQEGFDNERRDYALALCLLYPEDMRFLMFTDMLLDQWDQLNNLYEYFSKTLEKLGESILQGAKEVLKESSPELKGEPKV